MKKEELRQNIIDFQEMILAGCYKYELCRDNIDLLADVFMERKKKECKCDKWHYFTPYKVCNDCGTIIYT